MPFKDKSYISIYDNKDYASVSVRIGDTFASDRYVDANILAPLLAAGIFVPYTNPDSGIKCLRSKFPLVFEHTGLRRGTRSDKAFFTSVLSIDKPEALDVTSIRAMIANTQQPEAPKPETAEAPKGEEAF